ncbi:MAG: hypothetical protein RL490_2430 [Pseudomonadota bacterium]
MAKLMFWAVAAAIGLGASPSLAVTNLIKNGSFEAGSVGVSGFTLWTHTNVPDYQPTQDQPASVIAYNSNSAYPKGAYGERVSPDNVVSASPDAVGNKAAYFVGDFSENEALRQLTYLGVGNYKVGFSYYLTQNGLNNRGNSSLDATIIGIPVASTTINSSSQAKVWKYASGVGHISVAGWYDTAFVFNSNLRPSKDIVIDRVFAIHTKDPATVFVPPTPAYVPEPATWAMLLVGFGLVGSSRRQKRRLLRN